MIWTAGSPPETLLADATSSIPGSCPSDSSEQFCASAGGNTGRRHAATRVVAKASYSVLTKGKVVDSALCGHFSHQLIDSNDGLLYLPRAIPDARRSVEVLLQLGGSWFLASGVVALVWT